MKTFVKSVIAFSVFGAMHVSSLNAATYQIVDKGAADSLENTFTQQKNNVGDSVIAGSDIYNFPVQFQYLDLDDYINIYNLALNYHERYKDLEPLDDYNALLNGNVTANDLSWVILYLESKANDYEYQKVGDIFSLVNFNDQTSLFNVYDEKFADTNDYTYSTNSYVNGITDDGWIFGNSSAPYLPVDFTKSNGEDTTYWVREFTTRAFFSPDKGQTIVSVLPPEDTYGGESAILDISDTKIAVGYASTSVDEAAIDYIEDTSGGCSDDDTLEDMPFEVCVQAIATGMYNTEAFKWYVDAQGVLTTESLGHLVTPHEDDQRELVSIAQAVNSHGVVAGYSTGWVQNNEFNPSRNERSSLYAVIFRNGEVIDLNTDHEKYYNSRAYDINDSGIVVGHVTTLINGNPRTKFYYIDTNSDELIMEFPDDFFNGSSSTARAINERGYIVGEGEYETHNDSSANTRRKHAFLYDLNIDYFVDINDLLTCDSPYEVIEARDINENNEISGTAILKIQKRDSKGELMLDEDGQQLYEDVLRAVDIIPTEGEIENCAEYEEKVDRKGASTNVWIIFILAFSIYFRRKL